MGDDLSRRKVSPTPTEPLTDGLLDDLQAAPEPRVVLLVFFGGRADLARLTPGRPLVLGRKQPPADMCIADPKLSREHVRVVLAQDRRTLTVEDLGSTNGTWVAGRRVERASITIGEEVRFGGTLARAQVLGGDASSARGGGPLGDGSMIAGEAMRDLVEMAERVAQSRIPVILHGETGTGKELLARLLHEKGPRRGSPMVSVNCGAIAASLLESTLFGHEKGAFTGATQQHKGVFEEARGGTVFLDEAGELSAGAQAALLRVLETGRMARVGSVREIEVDVRVIAATHRNLEVMVERGEFRADLYYRLGTITLDIPPLRERVDEIEPLARHFLAIANRLNGRRVRDIAPEAVAILKAQRWPGNIRELKNTIDRAVVLARGEVIDAQDLPARMLAAAARANSTSAPPAGTPRPISTSATPPGTPRPTSTTAPPSGMGRPTPTSTPPAGTPRPTPTTTPPSGMEGIAPPKSEAPGEEQDSGAGELRAKMQQYEVQRIVEALQATGWNRAEAAKRLGLPLRTLARKIKALGIRRDDP